MWWYHAISMKPSLSPLLFLYFFFISLNCLYMKMINPGHSSIQFDQNIFGSDQLGRFIFWLFFLKSTSLNDNSLNKNYFVMSIIYLKGHLWMSIITFIKRRHPFTSLNYWKRRVGGFPLYPARLGFTLSTLA